MENAKRKKRAVLPVYVKGLVSGRYTLRQASESTGYSVWYLSRLKKAYVLQGDIIFENKNAGRVPVNKLSIELRQKIAAIYAAEYSDVNFCYFRECLREFEGISISYATLANILHEFGLFSPESRKTKKHEIHRPRVRRECEGDLIQIDGTPYAWFQKSGISKKYCMVGAIDDATGKITGLYITEFECLYGYLEILRQTCHSYGVPREIYSDRAAIFCYTPKGPKLAAWERLEVLHEKRTQWQRILEELYINQILAWSPQAKGRVERMWRTLQGQLPAWFYKKGIKTVEDANASLHEYIAWFNSQYSVEAAVDDPFWIDAPENLDEILCAQFPRHMSKDGVLTFQTAQFVVAPGGPDLSYQDVLLCINERGLFAKFKDQYFPLRPLDEPGTVRGGALSQTVINIIDRYLFAFAKDISA